MDNYHAAPRLERDLGKVPRPLRPHVYRALQGLHDRPTADNLTEKVEGLEGFLVRWVPSTEVEHLFKNVGQGRRGSHSAVSDYMILYERRNRLRNGGKRFVVHAVTEANSIPRERLPELVASFLDDT
jgi:hypothetical protein